VANHSGHTFEKIGAATAEKVCLEIKKNSEEIKGEREERGRRERGPRRGEGDDVAPTPIRKSWRL